MMTVKVPIMMMMRMRMVMMIISMLTRYLKAMIVFKLGKSVWPKVSSRKC